MYSSCEKQSMGTRGTRPSLDGQGGVETPSRRAGWCRDPLSTGTVVSRHSLDEHGALRPSLDGLGVVETPGGYRFASLSGYGGGMSLPGASHQRHSAESSIPICHRASVINGQTTTIIMIGVHEAVTVIDTSPLAIHDQYKPQSILNRQ